MNCGSRRDEPPRSPARDKASAARATEESRSQGRLTMIGVSDLAQSPRSVLRIRASENEKANVSGAGDLAVAAQVRVAPVAPGSGTRRRTCGASAANAGGTRPRPPGRSGRRRRRRPRRRQRRAREAGRWARSSGQDAGCRGGADADGGTDLLPGLHRRQHLGVLGWHVRGADRGRWQEWTEAALIRLVLDAERAADPQAGGD